MRNWILICLLGLPAFSDIQTLPERGLEKSFIKTLPEAVADTLLLDFPLDLTLWALGVGPTPLQMIPRAIATAGGYSVRKTCKDYQMVNGTVDWQVAAGCGFVGGALKYSTRSTITGAFNAVEPLVGAIDAGTYEGTGHLRGNYPTAEYMAIEGMVSAIQFAQAVWIGSKAFSKAGLMGDLKSGLAVGALVSGFVHTSIAWYGDSLTAKIREFLPKE